MTEAATPGPPAGGASPRGLPGRLRLLSDEGLARRAAKGDKRAFEAIYRRYHQDLYRFCLASTGDPQDAQEALQNTMVKVLRALPGEERHIQLRPWLYRIARNEAVETIRRRRDTAELTPEQAPAPAPLEIAATAEARDRLRGLLVDLEELPERQRAALVMREMADLGFEQIGESLGTSVPAARQTVYEARLGLRQMEAGREMDCDAVMRELSAADGRLARRRDIRAHLRACEGCRAFRESIAERRGGFAAIAPLPLAVSAGLLQGALGAGGASTAIATSALAKSAATVAVVAAVGAAAADRGGLIDAPVLGDGGREMSAEKAPRPAAPLPRGGEVGAVGPVKPTGAGGTSRSMGSRHGGSRKAGKGDRSGRGVSGARSPDAARGGGNGAGAPRGHGRHRGRPDGLPSASTRGQETAAARKAPPAQSSPGPGATAGQGGGKKGASEPTTAQPQKPPPSQQQKGAASARDADATPAAPAMPPAHGKEPKP